MTQRMAARAAGFLYLFQMATAMFGFYAKTSMIVRGDTAQTARNIISSERLFRFGIASDLVTTLAVVTLLWALYVVLNPVNRDLALLAAFFRLVENAIAGAAALSSLIALQLLRNAAGLNTVNADEFRGLAQVFFGAHGLGLEIAFVFVGAGSALFSYLWLKSRYIPRSLAILGIFASLVLAIVTLAVLVFPGLRSVISMAYMAPMGVYEVGLGLWLLIKGIRVPLAE